MSEKTDALAAKIFDALELGRELNHHRQNMARKVLVRILEDEVGPLEEEVEEQKSLETKLKKAKEEIAQLRKDEKGDK